MDTLFHMPLERTENADQTYSALGRALYLAVDFDNSCCALATIIGVKFSQNALATPNALAQLVTKLRRRRLAQQIEAISFGSASVRKTDLFRILDAGREARNEIAHSLTVGLLDPITVEPPEEFVARELQPLIQRIARAHIVVLLLGALFNRDPLPTQRSIHQLERRIVTWVCSE